MTLGRRHLRGTTQIAANAAALKNLFNGRHPPEFLPEAPGRPSKTVCKPFFQRTKGSLFCTFFDYSHQSLLIIFNYNRFIITATKAFVKKEKAGGEKRNSARPFGLVYEEILGIAKILSCFCGIDRRNTACSFSSFAAFHCFNCSGAIHCAPDSEESKSKGNSAINEKFSVGDVSKIACAGNSDNGDDSCCCHNLKDEVQNICSFHFTTSFPSLSMGYVRQNRTSVLVL